MRSARRPVSQAPHRLVVTIRSGQVLPPELSKGPSEPLWCPLLNIHDPWSQKLESLFLLHVKLSAGTLTTYLSHAWLPDVWGVKRDTPVPVNLFCKRSKQEDTAVIIIVIIIIILWLINKNKSRTVSPSLGHFQRSRLRMAWAGMRKANALAWNRGSLNTQTHTSRNYNHLNLDVTCLTALLRTHLTPSVVWIRVVSPTVVKMVPISWLMVFWSWPTHMASARRKGTAMVPLKHVR